MLSIQAHIKERHTNLSNFCVSLEEFGITQLPEYSKRRKQNFEELVIDENGDTPTGASTNPKNFNLNKNLNMNLI